MDKNGHLDPLLMSVAPETLPECSPGYLIISLQGLSLKMKIYFTMTILRFFSYRAQKSGPVPRFGPGKYSHLDPLVMSVAPETFPKGSPGYEIIYLQGLSLKMKIDFTVTILRFFSYRARLGPVPRFGPKNGKIWPFGPLLMTVAPETFPMRSPG